MRLMTVHKAKGLEFPVVVLADIACGLSRDDASRYLDPARGLCAMQLAGWVPLDLIENNDREARRDEAEGVRLAYVAATRARDVLVVPAIGDGPFDDGWVAAAESRALSAGRRSAVAALAVAHARRSRAGTRCSNVRTASSQALDTVRPGAYDVIDPVSQRARSPWSGGIRCCSMVQAMTRADCVVTT